MLLTCLTLPHFSVCHNPGGSGASLIRPTQLATILLERLYIVLETLDSISQACRELNLKFNLILSDTIVNTIMNKKTYINSANIISKYCYQVNQLERELEQLKQRFRTTQSEVRLYYLYLSSFIEITNIVTYDLYIDRCKFYFLSINDQKYCY